eukprot:428607-Pleurochrysis_carterae.AAC.1
MPSRPARRDVSLPCPPSCLPEERGSRSSNPEQPAHLKSRQSCCHNDKQAPMPSSLAHLDIPRSGKPRGPP